MKIPGCRCWRLFLLLALLVGAADFVTGGAVTNDHNNAAASGVTTQRKMKENNGIRGHGGHRATDVSLDDYRPVDPSPSSKAVRPGPIQHGTPLNPYIPKPAPPPPSHPKFADYDP